MAPDQEPPPDRLEEIDETATAAPAPGLGYIEVSRPYNSQQQLDAVRSRLTYCLVGLLAISIVGGFALVLTAPLTDLPLDGIRLIIEIIITPTVALVSAATGFYFGAQLSGGRRHRSGR